MEQLHGALKRVRRIAKRALAKKPRQESPILSVVVPVYNVVDYLAATLDSLLVQQLNNIEIVIIDDGSTDGSAKVAKRYARKNAGIKYFRQENQGLSAARNAGSSRALGKYLAFLDSDDLVYPNTYKLMVDTLEETKSDFIVSNYERLQDGKKIQAGRWIREAHRERILRTAIQESPEMLVSQVAWNKVYRMSFWRKNSFSFPIGRLYEDQIVSTQAFVAAKSFDVLPNRLFRWRIRESGTSITQSSHELLNLKEQVASWRQTLDYLESAGEVELALTRKRMILANDLPRLVADSVQGGDEFKDVLATVIADYSTQQSADVFADVRVQHRIAFEYLLSGNYKAVDDYVSNTGMSLWNIGVRAVPGNDPLPLVNEFLEEAALPSVEEKKFGKTQFLPVMELRRWNDTDGQSFEFSGWAYITNHDTQAYPVSLSVRAINKQTGQVAHFSLSQHRDLEANLRSGSQYCDYSYSGFTATINLQELAHAGTWYVEVEIRQGNVCEVRKLTKIRSKDISANFKPHTVDGLRITTKHDISDGLYFMVKLAPAVVGKPVLVEGKPMLELSGQMPDDALVVLTDSLSRKSVAGTVRRTANGRYLALPSVLPETNGFAGWRDIEIRWSVSGGPSKTVGFLNDHGVERPVTAEGLSFDMSRAGNVKLVEHVNHVVVENLAIGVHSINLEFECLGWSGDEIIVQLQHRGDLVEAVASRKRNEANKFTAELDFSTLHWRQSAKSLPLGLTKLSFTMLDTKQDLVVSVTPAIRQSLPLLIESQTTRVWVSAASTHIAFTTETPISTNIRAPFSQRLLKESYLASTAPVVENAVLFRTYYGESTTCNALAVHEEMVAQGLDFKKYWAVKDHTVRVPEGGIPVVYNSEEWFQVLGTAKYYIDNVHQPDYTQKKPGQVFIQTMHGYPFKQMGHSYWEDAGYSEARISSFDKRAAEWDIFVSPAGYASKLLKDEFQFPGDMAQLGYPRNDILVRNNSAAQTIRALTRDTLGISADVHVVLYAPTWRDYESTGEFKSELVNFVDYREVAEALGPNYVLLVRGHQMAARTETRLGRAARVLDVTDYPEIRDLIIASDSAVLDYSSLRFDYALTGKPMTFLVPDLQEYQESRGWLLDYEPTAPGEFVVNQRQLVRAIRTAAKTPDRFAEATAALKSSYMELEDGEASGRLVALMLSTD